MQACALISGRVNKMMGTFLLILYVVVIAASYKGIVFALQKNDLL